MTIEDALRWAYDLEINVEIGSFWNAGWTVRLGDRVNGYKVATELLELEEIPDEIVSLIDEHYPEKPEVPTT